MSALPPPPPPQGWVPVQTVPLYAGFWRRVAARLMDGIIVSLLMIPTFVSILSDVDAQAGLTIDQRDRLRGASLVILLISAVYEISLIAWRGQTLGKMALGIKVVPSNGRGSVGLGWSAVRWVIPAAAGQLPGLGGLLSLLIYLWMLWDPMKQGLHDKAARTLVVRVGR